MDAVIVGFDNVGVAVTDLGRALEFWTGLGFERVSEDDGEQAALLRAGSAFLWVFETRSPMPAQARNADLLANPPGIDHLSLAVDDVDATHRALEERGVQFEWGPDDRWGYRVAALRDPDGTQVFLLTALPATDGPTQPAG
jgi:catechol 2,3-dioxygenase-like lactoylglutathione lyase family enzyme